MQSKMVRSTVLAAVGTLTVSLALIYLGYLLMTGGAGIFSGIFISLVISMFVCPPLLFVSLFHVLFERRRRVVSLILSVGINLAIAYWLFRKLVPQIGVSQHGATTIVRHTGVDASGVVDSFVFFAIASAAVIGVFFWIEGKLYAKES